MSGTRGLSNTDWKTSVSGLCEFQPLNVFNPTFVSASFEMRNVLQQSHVPAATHPKRMCALNRWVGDRCCWVKIESASTTLRGLWFKRKKKKKKISVRRMRRENVTRERERKVNAWNRWPTDQARSHHHRRRHQHRSVRESWEAAGGGRRAWVSHASHAALRGKPREEAFDEAFTGKT